MLLRTISALCLLLSSLVFAPSGPAYAVEINQFSAGLVCGKNDNATPIRQPVAERICFETETIYITGSSTCVFDGYDIPCTWFGFEFEYSDLSDGDTIICEGTSSQPHTYGNPNEVIAENATEFEFTLTPEPGAGRFYNPQYTAFMYRPIGYGREIRETTCRSGDEELFQFRFEIILPEWAD